MFDDIDLKVTADDVKKYNPDQTYLRGVMRSTLKEIEETVRSAVRDKKTSIIYPLQLNFAVQQMTNRDAQQLVYSTLIQKLKDNGFRVVLKRNNKKELYLDVTWITEEDLKEMADRAAIINRAKSRP